MLLKLLSKRDLSRKPRASSEMAVVSRRMSSGSHVSDAERFVGKLVATTGFVMPVIGSLPCQSPPMNLLTPCWASLQYAYEATPRRGIAGALDVDSWAAFSASVIRDTRSAARSSNE